MESDNSIFSFCEFSFSCLDPQIQSPRIQASFYKPSQELTKRQKNFNSPKKVSLTNSIISKKNVQSHQMRRRTFGTFHDNRTSLRDKKHNKKLETNEIEAKQQNRNTNYTSSRDSGIFYSNSIPLKHVSDMKSININSSFQPSRLSQANILYYKNNNYKNNQSENFEFSYPKQSNLQRIQSLKSNNQHSKVKQILRIPQKEKQRRSTNMSQFSKSFDDLEIRQTVSLKDETSNSDSVSEVYEEDLAEFKNLQGLKVLNHLANGKQMSSYQQKRKKHL